MNYDYHRILVPERPFNSQVIGDNRELAMQQQNRAARALRLQEQAAALEAEAATWQLLWHLHGVRGAAFPAGSGGQPALGNGRELTVAQRAAAILAENEKLNWCGTSITIPPRSPGLPNICPNG